MALPIPDLCCNIAASIIYDPAKWLVGKLTDNPKFREIKAKYGWLESPNDFPDRFAEAFVALFRDEKPKVLRSFFGEISVVQAIEDVKWGKISRVEFDQKIATAAQRMTVAAQLVGTGLNLETEIELFLAYFAEAANDSRTAAQAEDHQLFAGIDRKIDGLRPAAPTPIWEQKFPNVAPYPKPLFFGDSRTDELADVHTRLRGDQCLVLVNGMGGIGKTSVAAAFCKDFEAEFVCIVWMHCGGSVREAFLRSPLFGRLFPAGSFQPGTSDEVIFEAMLAQMASAPGRKLLVLDNANDGDDLIANRRRLEALPGWAVLITSRAEATGLPERKIGTLPLDRARALFCKHHPPAATQTALLDRLLVAIGCHTLLLEIIAKQLAERQRKGKTAELQPLCDRLERDGLLALPHPDAVKVDWQNHPPAPPEALLDALFDLAALPTDAQATLLWLAMLPAEPQPLPRLYLLFEVVEDGPEEAAFDARVDGLARSGWLECLPDTAGYRMHPLASEAVRRRLPHGYDDCAALVERLIALLDGAETHLDTRLDLCEAARTVAARLSGAGNGRVATLLFHLADTEFTAGNYNDTEYLLTEAAAIFEAAGEIQNHAVALSRLGQFFQNLGDFDRALAFFEKQTDLFEELYAANPRNEGLKNGLAISYSKLGDLWQKRGDFDRALAFFEKQTDLFEELYAANPRNEGLKNGLAISYYKLAGIYEQQGNLDKALVFYEKDTKLTEEAYFNNPKSAQLKQYTGISYRQMGSILTKLGRVQEADVWFSKAKHLE